MIAVLSVIMVFLDGTLRRRRRGRLPACWLFFMCAACLSSTCICCCVIRGGRWCLGWQFCSSRELTGFIFISGKNSAGPPVRRLCLALCLAACVTVGAYAGGSLVKHGLSYIPVAVEELKAGGEEPPPPGPPQDSRRRPRSRKRRILQRKPPASRRKPM